MAAHLLRDDRRQLVRRARSTATSSSRAQEALRLFTRGNSWFLRMEDKIGSIETGKLADLVVLDRDYFTVPEVQIKQIKSLLTIVDGKIVHGLSDVCT